MPLSNQQGEGFENKIAKVIGAALGTGVQYYWRPSIERGLMRTTLSEGNCDLWIVGPKRWLIRPRFDRFVAISSRRRRGRSAAWKARRDSSRYKTSHQKHLFFNT